MLNIVVYGGNRGFITNNINYIDLAFSDYSMGYQIHRFENYNKEIDLIIRDDGMKIYILDISSDNKSGLKIASRIREYDWDSVIIIIGLTNKFIDNVYCNKLMVLDYICNYEDYESRIVDDIKVAISIIGKHKILSFRYNRVIYRIPFDQINYIEKESDIKRCIIHTYDNEYHVTSSIKTILSQLDESFCRTHQSCIVNLNNIKKIDLSNNMMIFKNGDKTDMLTGKMKRVVKKHIELI